MVVKRRPGAAGTSKSPAIFSHEFVIQNHADIVSCLAMIIVVGLLFQVSQSLASVFVQLQHNASEPIVTQVGTFMNYTSGPRDSFMIFFYVLITIVIHAIIQEYGLDKINKKLSLSKSKFLKFNESGQYVVFFTVSLLWAAEIIRREGLLSISRLSSDFPAAHVEMSYLHKFYFIIQIAHWIHAFPEFYFQRMKSEEILPRAFQAGVYLFLFTAAYVLSFTRIAIVLSAIHYGSDMIFHLARLVYFSNKTKSYKSLFNLYNIVFVLARLLTMTLSVLTFWYGLADAPFASRVTALAGVCSAQALMMWTFINFHLGRLRERFNEAARKKKNAAAVANKKKFDDLDELPEADQSPASSSRRSNKIKTK